MMSFERTPKPKVPEYRMYVDESGDHSYSKLDQPWHCHLALIGLFFRLRDDYVEFEEGLTRLKRDVFGLLPDDHLILHLSEIKGRKGIFGRLRDESVDRVFCEQLLRLIKSSRFAMVLAVIDKKSHQARYADPVHPYHYLMTAITERYAFWLSERTGVGDAMVEARGKREDAELSAEFTKIVRHGTRYLREAVADRVFSSAELKVRNKSDDIAGLQLADLLAHPMKRRALVERGLCDDRGGFAREVAQVAMPKYRGFRDGRIVGHGLKWF